MYVGETTGWRTLAKLDVRNTVAIATDDTSCISAVAAADDGTSQHGRNNTNTNKSVSPEKLHAGAGVVIVAPS